MKTSSDLSWLRPVIYLYSFVLFQFFFACILYHFHVKTAHALYLMSSFKLILVPFDEDERDLDVWFLDHDYLENMYTMFKKVNGQ